ncbi:MAG TPA: type II toxin-antitoxin system HicA family toxin [Candidatus Limnocylindrales bacterium]|nr:type II toxin-antitoxin system HicA family toxin [Candidatus Limnocylindrales bacterium]
MPKLPRWTAAEAERALATAGFVLLRSKGSHRIYGKGAFRVTVPFHAGASLHPKIIKQALEIIDEAAQSASLER